MSSPENEEGKLIEYERPVLEDIDIIIEQNSGKDILKLKKGIRRDKATKLKTLEIHH